MKQEYQVQSSDSLGDWDGVQRICEKWNASIYLRGTDFTPNPDQWADMRIDVSNIKVSERPFFIAELVNKYHPDTFHIHGNSYIFWWD